MIILVAVIVTKFFHSCFVFNGYFYFLFSVFWLVISVVEDKVWNSLEPPCHITVIKKKTMPYPVKKSVGE